MKINQFMKRNVISIPSKTTISEAAAVIVKKHVGTLPVLDNQGKPIGVIRLEDLLTLEMPDFIHLISNINFIHDFGAVETTRPAHRLLEKDVTTIMQPVITIQEDTGLLHAYAIMLQNNIYDMPVTTETGELVGIVSRADIGSAILATWSAE